MSLENKTIVVTGAASGIGEECARLMKSRGAQIIGIDRNPTERNVDLFIRADLGDPASIAAAVKQIPHGLDALCNIAGLPPTCSAASVHRVNFTGLRELTEALISKMNDGASIVNLASLAGLGWPATLDQVKALIALRDFDQVEKLCGDQGIDDVRSYFLSKEALIVWTMQNRWTWRSRNIRMNAVSPGPVETAIHQDFLQTLGKRAEEDMRLLERVARPEDIAPVVAFLCSEQSAWIRGTNIPCDGGMLSHVYCDMNGLV